MAMYEVDDDLAFLVDRLAPRNKPFENLSFQEGLRRVLNQYVQKKAPTPSAVEYASSVPELRRQRDLTTWKAICDALEVETSGDSARRKLAAWVKFNRPDWPPVPSVE
jgi:hypothetical protein